MATRDEIRAFAGRRWDEHRQPDADHWRRWRRAHGAAGALAVAEQLRRNVQVRRPDWPSEAERRDDLACHLRVTEALRRVPSRRR